MSREEMLTERDRLLASVHVSEAELRQRAASWELDAHERGVLAEVDGLDWLLANTRE